MLLEYVSTHGLLLLQHKTLPSAVGLITGEQLSTSWWSHPRAQEIFRALGSLEDSGNVIATRLLDKRVTFVHRKLWPAIEAIGTSHEPWQMRGLPPDARKLLARVNREKRVADTSRAAKLLQERLLLHAHGEHTDSGKHVTVLEPWSALGMREIPLDRAKREIERAADRIGAADKLPWVGGGSTPPLRG